MMKAAENRHGDDARSRRRARRGKVLGPVGRLESQAAMRTSLIVDQVLGEDALNMALVSEENVVGATSSDGADHALRICVRLRRTRRCDEGPHAKSANSGAEHAAVDGVAVMDEETGSLVGVDGGLNDTLGGPGRREFASDQVLAQGGVLTPHAADQTTKIEVDRRAATRSPGAPPPEKPPASAVPADDGFGLHDDDGVKQTAETAAERSQEPAVEALQTRALCPATQDDELVAKEKVFRDERGPWRREPEDECHDLAKKRHGWSSPTMGEP